MYFKVARQSEQRVQAHHLRGAQVLALEQRLLAQRAGELASTREQETLSPNTTTL